MRDRHKGGRHYKEGSEKTSIALNSGKAVDMDEVVSKKVRSRGEAAADWVWKMCMTI